MSLMDYAQIDVAAAAELYATAADTGLVYHNGAYRPASQVWDPWHKIIAAGWVSYYKMPGFCEPCDVYGDAYEPDCWYCLAPYTYRKPSPSPQPAGQNTATADSPTWRQVIGADPWYNPEPIGEQLHAVTQRTNHTPAPAVPEGLRVLDPLRWWFGQEA